MIFPPLSPQVSWVRHRDVHILSVGANTFTTDDRDGSEEENKKQAAIPTPVP